MMNKFKNFIVALGVFTMMIGNGFAKDTNPPTEPVKKSVVTEMGTDAPTQSIYIGDVGYFDPISGLCRKLTENPMHCSKTQFNVRCQYEISSGVFVDLFTYEVDPDTGAGICLDELWEIPIL